jgi:UDP:flavonoid glycosyltransferase YjiC (YdhE family)
MVRIPKRIVVTRSPYWEDQHILTGYWFEEEEVYSPSEELTAFLKSGEKPVLLALGAMSFEDKAETDKLDMFVKAFQKAGCRAIIQGFQKSLEEYKLPETMMSVGSVPHSWLFKQCSFVIHHCGFGTSAATMIYGIPSIPVPHVLDQMGFAMKLRNLNVATEPLKAKELTEENIYNSIVQMQDTYDEKSKNAMEISDKIRTEGGLSEAVRLIESVI